MFQMKKYSDQQLGMLLDKIKKDKILELVLLMDHYINSNFKLGILY
ncbi:hypothetical protein CNEO4_680012 [Clostridium neonatale]|nr:hypothetical protein CNEO4_680012 [Clostridium neonatale]